MDLRQILQDCKSSNLRRHRVDGRGVVSLSVSNPGHFQWFEELAGAPAHHIAVPVRGAGLEGPDHVSWASRGPDGILSIESGSADFVWADESLDRLWPDEAPTLLAEVRRILSPEGLLVITGQNRAVPSDAQRPGRPLDLTSAEAFYLLNAAGFDVHRAEGLLLCLDRFGRPIPTHPIPSAIDLDIIGRCVSGSAAPDRSYAWWIEARASARLPDLERLDVLLRPAGVSSALRRLDHMEVGAGANQRDVEGRVVLDWPAARSGIVMQGPCAPLRPGHYRATVQVQRRGRVSAGAALGLLEASLGGRDAVLAQKAFGVDDIPSGVRMPVAVEFELDRPTDDFHLRVSATGGGGFTIDRRIGLSSLFWKPFRQVGTRGSRKSSIMTLPL